MIEIIILLIVIAVAVRRPRTYAEAQYRNHVRRENRQFVFFVVLLGALVFCVWTFIHAIQLP
jgi:amino acid permease